MSELSNRQRLILLAGSLAVGLAFLDYTFSRASFGFYDGTFSGMNRLFDQGLDLLTCVDL